MGWGAQCAAACCTNRAADPGGLCAHCEFWSAVALREADARLALLAGGFAPRGGTSGNMRRHEPKAPSPWPCATCGKHPRVLGSDGAKRVECTEHLCWRGPVKMDAETAIEYWDLVMAAAGGRR